MDETEKLLKELRQAVEDLKPPHANVAAIQRLQQRMNDELRMLLKWVDAFQRQHETGLDRDAIRPNNTGPD